MTYRIGIIGAGYITQSSLIKAIEARDELHLVAVLDPDPQAVETVSRMSAHSVCTSSEAEFFATPMDAVHVATPNNLHEYYACRALSRRLTTLVEKPLAASMKSGRRIVEMQRRSGSVAMMGYMSEYNGANRHANGLIDSGAIGTPRAMTALCRGWSAGTWRNRRREAGLGSLGDLGIYPVLTAVRLFGAEPTSCQAVAWPCGHPEDSDIYAEGTIWFEGTQHLHLESSFIYKPTPDWVCEYTVIGHDGILRVSDSWRMDGHGHIDIWNSAGHQKIVPTPVDQYAEQYMLLAACSAGADVPAGVTLARGLRDLAILYALDESSINGGARTNIDPVLLGGM